MSRSGAEIIVETLRSQGVTHVFANPGSTELALIDAITGSGDISYVLGLHENCVIAMAEGYAQATGRPAVVNVHTMSGLGNSIGMLTNALVNGAPLVVTAGHQHQKLLVTDPLLSHDLTGMTATVTKWRHEPRHVDELGVVLRRAFHDVMAPPRGPVFVSLPSSLMSDETEQPLPPVSTISHESVAGGLDRMAELLVEHGPHDTALVFGIDAALAGALPEAVRLAETLGVPVHGVPNPPIGVFPPGHPLWRGHLVGLNTPMRNALARYRRILFVGGQVLQISDYEPAGPLPPGLELLHLSPDPAQIGRTYATVCGTSGALRPSLARLAEEVERRVDRAAAQAALAEARAARAEAIAEEERQALALYGPAPIDPRAAIHAALRAAPEDIIVVDEAISNTTSVRTYHRWTEPGRMFSAKQIIGWGMGASIGIALAHGGERPVLSITSDGGATFSPQALWTAAREKLPILFVVLVNREYGILKKRLRAMGGYAARSNDFRSMDLVDPQIDYASIARGFGVEAVTVDHADAIGDVVRAALAQRKPLLLQVPTRPE
jgi:benzoylformate decarboxylase